MFSNMTDSSIIKFVIFRTEHELHTKPVSNITETINFVGKISKGGFRVFSVDVKVTLPDKNITLL